MILREQRAARFLEDRPCWGLILIEHVVHLRCLGLVDQRFCFLLPNKLQHWCVNTCMSSHCSSNGKYLDRNIHIIVWCSKKGGFGFKLSCFTLHLIYLDLEEQVCFDLWGVFCTCLLQLHISHGTSACVCVWMYISVCVCLATHDSCIYPDYTQTALWWSLNIKTKRLVLCSGQTSLLCHLRAAASGNTRRCNKKAQQWHW